MEQYLVSATMSLPETVAASMEQALARGTYQIRAGRYADGHAVCPLGAADAFATEERGTTCDGWYSATDSSEGYGGDVMRFAISFDLCAAQDGLDAALDVVTAALARRHAVEQSLETTGDHG